MKLDFPVNPPPTVKKEGKLWVKDRIMGHYRVLTPEEWVRQHLLGFLIDVKRYPASRMGVEVSLNYEGRSKRCDVLLWDGEGTPFLMAECKAPYVQLKDSVFQIGYYNAAFKVPWLMVTNGMLHHCFQFSEMHGEYQAVSEVPPFTS